MLVMGMGRSNNKEWRMSFRGLGEKNYLCKWDIINRVSRSVSRHVTKKKEKERRERERESARPRERERERARERSSEARWEIKRKTMERRRREAGQFFSMALVFTTFSSSRLARKSSWEMWEKSMIYRDRCERKNEGCETILSGHATWRALTRL